jgi:diguanylate cyclase (GGDEF)-like protein/PAS domain S-box-containing protein
MAATQAWWWYLAILVAGMPIYFFSTSGTTQSFVYDAYGFSSAAAILVGIRINRPEKRGPWLAFAVGMALFAVGDVFFNVYSLVGHSVPKPSVADFLYLLAYPVIGVGMLLLVRSRTPDARFKSALDGLIVAVAVGVLAWISVLGHYARDPALSVAGRLTAIAYPMWDLLLVVIIIRLVFSAGVRNLSYRLLFASVAFLLVADGIYAVAQVHDWYSFTHATPIDLGWLISYALWGAAALHPSMGRLAEPAESGATWRPRAALVVLSIAAMTTPAVIIVRELLGERSDQVLLTGAATIVFMMILLRLWIVTKNFVTANRHLADASTRQAVLITAAAAFVGASDLEAIANAGVRAAVSLAHGGESWSSFVTDGRLEPTVVAVAGPAPVRVGDRSDGPVRATGQEIGREVASQIPVIVGHANRGTSPVLLFAEPVKVDNEVRGYIRLSYSSDNAQNLTSSVRMLCAEMGLALKGVESTEERLREQNERRLRSLMQKSTDLLTLVESSGRILYLSPAAFAMLGRQSDEMVGRHWSEFIHPEDASAFRDQLAKVQLEGRQATVEGLCRWTRSDDSTRVVSTVMTNMLEDPDINAIVLNSQDVTERHSLEQRLHDLAFHDSITGLPNRAFFVDQVGQALDRTRGQVNSIAVLHIDLDDFKNINDSIGHEAGDKVLAAAGDALAIALRPGDTLARLEGDEFAVLLEIGGLPDVAQTVAHRILGVFDEPIRVGDGSLPLHVSIGIALNVSLDDGPDSLLRNANLAMGSAKQSGKSRSEMFQREMYSQAVHRHDIATELFRALGNEELQVFYQPIVATGNLNVMGAEALIRWDHERFGMIPAIEFIEVAELSRLIIVLGDWVLNMACAQAQSWRESGVVDESFYVSVNLSARQLGDPEIVERVSRALLDSGLPPGSLVLEITESTLMFDFEAGLARLHSLGELGLRLALDDYGTGYSSLNRLATLPVDIVKIDKTFIDRLTTDKAGKALVRSIVDVVSALGMSCVAEGVETPDQCAALAEMGCDSIQGYLFAGPTSALESALILRTLGAPQPTRS